MVDLFSSEDALRIYFVTTSTVTLMVSLFVAFIVSKEVVREEPVLGRPPTTLQGVEKAIRRVRSFRWRFLLRWGASTLAVAAYGLLFPLMIFFLVADNVGWLLPNEAVFLLSADRTPLTSVPDAQQLLQYVGYQAWNSITLDYSEVALNADTRVVHNPNISLVFWTVFVFRALIELTGLNWLQASARGAFGAVFGNSKLANRLSALEEQRAKLTKDQTSRAQNSNDNDLAEAA
ncbi:MAG: hypothetical protein ACKVRO_18640 [Micropepsaceae bacterium]